MSTSPHCRVELSSGAYVVVPGRAADVWPIQGDPLSRMAELAISDTQTALVDPLHIVAVWDLWSSLPA